MRFSMKSRLRAAGVFTGLSVVCITQQARADIKSDTDHPHYFFEAEPHLSIAPFNTDKVGIGAGFAGTFNVANEGFIKRVNDSVGVGFGVDWTGNKNWELLRRHAVELLAFGQVVGIWGARCGPAFARQ